MRKSRLDYNICEVRRKEFTQWFFDLISEFLKKDYPNNKIKEGNIFMPMNFLLAESLLNTSIENVSKIGH